MASEPQLIDTHCHLNLAEHFPHPGEAIARARDAGVTRVIVVGIDIATCRRAIELAEAHEGLYAIVGLHPNHAYEHSGQVMKEIEEMAQHPKVVAIGEIGLDYHWDFSTPAQQEASLRDQLDLARSLQKPVVFHCREAYPDLLTILEAMPIWTYLFHCFSGDESAAERAMDLDGWFGIDGPVTYKKSAALRELVTLLPPDRIVLETDSPYLSPEPVRGKPNQPANLRFVNNALASALGKTAQETAELTTANAVRFFGL